MSLAIDIFLLCVIILPMIGGIRRGFVASVMGILTFAAALVCAWLFTPALSAYYLETVFMARVSKVVGDAIASLLSSGLDLGSLFSDLPEAFTSLTDRFGADISRLSSYYTIQESGGASDVAGKVAGFIAQPVAEAVSDVLAFLTIFVGAVIILKVISLILDLIFKLPVLNALNRFAGFIFGAGCGYLYASIFAVILVASAPALTALLPEYFSAAAFDGSALLTALREYGMFAMIDIYPI